MKNMKPFTVFVIAILLLNTSICEAQTTYSVEYSPDSPMKNIPLKNASLKFEMYSYEKPYGYKIVKTDNNQRFSLKKNHYLEVIEIIGEEKYNAHCSGYVTPSETKLKINCSPE